MKKVIPNNSDHNIRIPVKMWLDDIEDGALEQAKNLARLPFAFKHIAIMPDSHRGYGMPIGGVLATKEAIIPNAVGVDIGCVDKDTEFLSPSGWKKISEYDGERVMQFNPGDETGEFTKPIKYIKDKCNEFYHIKTKYGVDQMLSPDHRCLVYKYDRSYNFDKREVWKARELAEKHNSLKNGFRHRFLTSFTPNITGRIGISDEDLRVLVMVSADAHLRNSNTGNYVIRLRKDRKIKRAKKLLNEAGIEYTLNNSNNNTNTISFNFGWVKGLSSLWGASLDQLRVISDEVLYWDGSEENTFYTLIKEEADFLNYVFTACGFRSTISIDNREDGTDYRVFKHKNTKVGINGDPKTNIRKVVSKDGYKYCFTVPSSYLVLRRNGNVFITGNCGMCAVKTNIRYMDITKKSLKKVMGLIRERVPTGFNHHNEIQDEKWVPNGDDYDLPPDSVVAQQYNKACYQIGTLGGGNHFIEIQEGSDGYIWIMIHSGSRNIGYKTAEAYRKKAENLCEKWYSDVPKDLAFLPRDTVHFSHYYEEMKYCVDFAEANRNLMMDRVQDALVEVLELVEFKKAINKPHNFASFEHHFNENVIVHRKGACRARLGEPGMIPGSQGQPSFIVEGKGEEMSFKSCSHGAGRKMSRTQAKKELSLEDEIENLMNIGVIHTLRGKDDLDEAPGSYKDINEVISNQQDLVEIKTWLRPLATVKG
jgi:tRNA-splicing ligase RtcB